MNVNQAWYTWWARFETQEQFLDYKYGLRKRLGLHDVCIRHELNCGVGRPVSVARTIYNDIVGSTPKNALGVASSVPSRMPSQRHPNAFDNGDFCSIENAAYNGGFLHVKHYYCFCKSVSLWRLTTLARWRMRRFLMNFRWTALVWDFLLTTNSDVAGLSSLRNVSCVPYQ